MSSGDKQPIQLVIASKEETAMKLPHHHPRSSSMNNHDNSPKDNQMTVTATQMICILSKTGRNRTDHDEAVLQQHFKTHPFFVKLSQQHSLNISQLAIRKLAYLHLTLEEQLLANAAAVFLLSTGSSADSQLLLGSSNAATSPKQHENQEQVLDDRLQIAQLQDEYHSSVSSSSTSPLEFHCAYLSNNNLEAVLNVKLNEQHQQKMKLLLTSGLFNEFSKTALFNLATSKYLQEQEYHYQQLVYDQGSQINGIYFIVSGIFSVWKLLSSTTNSSSLQANSPKSIRVAELQQVGGAFGYEEICCSEPTRRNQIVSNSSESKVLFLPIQFCGRLVQQGKAQAAAQIQSREAVVWSRQRLEHSRLAIFLCKSKEQLESGEQQDGIREDNKNMKDQQEEQGDSGEIQGQGLSKLQDQLVRLPDISIKSRDVSIKNTINTITKNSILTPGITNCPSKQQQQQSQLLQALDRSYKQAVRIHHKGNLQPNKQLKNVQDAVNSKANQVNSSLITSIPEIDTNELKQPKSYSANRRDEFQQIQQSSSLFLSQKKKKKQQQNTSQLNNNNSMMDVNTSCFDNKGKNLIISLDCILKGDNFKNPQGTNGQQQQQQQGLNGLPRGYQKRIALPHPIKNNHSKPKEMEETIIKQTNQQPDNIESSNKIIGKPKVIPAIYSPNNSQSSNTLSQVLGDEIEQQLTLEREQQLSNFALIISQNSCLQWKGGITEDSVLTHSTLKAVKLNGNKKLAQIPHFNRKRSSTNSIIGNNNNNTNPRELSPLQESNDPNSKSSMNHPATDQTDYFYGGPFMKNLQRRRQIASLNISSSVLFPLLSPNKIVLQGISPSAQSLPSSSNKYPIYSPLPTQQLPLERHMFSKRNSISKPQPQLLPQPIGGNSNCKSLCSESSMISPASDTHLDSRILSRYNTDIDSTSLLASTRSPSLNRQFLRKTRKRIKEKLLTAHAEKQLEGALQLYQELVLASAETLPMNHKNTGPIMKTVSLRISNETENHESKYE